MSAEVQTWHKLTPTVTTYTPTSYIYIHTNYIIIHRFSFSVKWSSCIMIKSTPQNSLRVNLFTLSSGDNHANLRNNYWWHAFHTLDVTKTSISLEKCNSKPCASHNCHHKTVLWIWGTLIFVSLNGVLTFMTDGIKRHYLHIFSCICITYVYVQTVQKKS